MKGQFRAAIRARARRRRDARRRAYLPAFGGYHAKIAELWQAAGKRMAELIHERVAELLEASPHGPIAFPPGTILPPMSFYEYKGTVDVHPVTGATYFTRIACACGTVPCSCSEPDVECGVNCDCCPYPDGTTPADKNR